MKRTRFASGLLFALVSLMLVACGDDLEDKQINEVTDEDAQALCEQQSEYAASAFSADAKRGACVLSAGLAAGEMCADAVQSCIDAGEAELPVSTDSSECGTATASDAPDCDATVGEALDCSEALVDQISAYYATVTCEDPGDGSGFEDLPAACESYFEKCPEAAPAS